MSSSCGQPPARYLALGDPIDGMHAFVPFHPFAAHSESGGFVLIISPTLTVWQILAATPAQPTTPPLQDPPPILLTLS